MNDREALKYFARFKTYTPEPIVEEPLIHRIDYPTLIAFFRCNSCTSCLWRENVIDKDADERHDIHFCARMHDSHNLIDMVSYLGYSKEGRERDVYPKYEEVKHE